MTLALTSLSPPSQSFDRDQLLAYFQNTWALEDLLFSSIKDDETYYLKPDALRNPLIFYLGHSAVFYLNKLIRVNLLSTRINPHYELLFELGVDPETPEELEEATKAIDWPTVESVRHYRQQAYQVIGDVISQLPETSLNFPVLPDHPLWALLMGFEHQRIHIETSSMLLRQLPCDRLERPAGWHYAPSQGEIKPQAMAKLEGGQIALGKSWSDPDFGWDSDYGALNTRVNPFEASPLMVTNGEFLEFVNQGGYHNPDYWPDESGRWRSQHQPHHPRFWVKGDRGYEYRTIFEQMPLPLDYPVEVNHYEAMAFCWWRGDGYRLMTEAEWQWAAFTGAASSIPSDRFNLNFTHGSPSPVGAASAHCQGLADLRGNVWEWLGDPFKPLPGFKAHYLYKDYSEPFFDDRHYVLRGGAWITGGTGALGAYRNWFRPYFYQHAGFRLARSL
jgi:5-histidylcysteine sulfoxide synthase